MLQKNLKQNQPGADFIVFLNQQFNDRKKEEHGIKAKRGLALKINKPAKIKHAPKKNSTHEDEKIISILKVTVPPKKSCLNKILNEHFPEPDIDIEERVVMEWLKRAMRYIEAFIDGIRYGVTSKNKKNKSHGKLYSFIFSVSEKSSRAKQETEEGFITRPRVAKLVISGIAALFISIAIVWLMPNFAFKIIGFYDRITVYPIMKIVQKTSPDLRNYNFFSKQTIEQSKKPITKKMLADYIVNNKPFLKNTSYDLPLALDISGEDLRGKVAGASVVSESASPDFRDYYNYYPPTKTSESNYIYDFLLSVLDNLADKQNQISENLNEKLVEFIKDKFQLDK